MDTTLKTAIESLVKKAAEASGAAQAVNFAQAACNSANALRVVADIERLEQTP